MSRRHRIAVEADTAGGCAELQAGQVHHLRGVGVLGQCSGRQVRHDASQRDLPERQGPVPVLGLRWHRRGPAHLPREELHRRLQGADHSAQPQLLLGAPVLGQELGRYGVDAGRPGATRAHGPPGRDHADQGQLRMPDRYRHHRRGMQLRDGVPGMQAGATGRLQQRGCVRAHRPQERPAGGSRARRQPVQARHHRFDRHPQRHAQRHRRGRFRGARWPTTTARQSFAWD